MRKWKLHTFLQLYEIDDYCIYNQYYIPYQIKQNLFTKINVAIIWATLEIISINIKQISNLDFLIQEKGCGEIELRISDYEYSLELIMRNEQEVV